ncbi:BLUF domain-containing protein [Sphingomonas psychrotolerans]|uniref:Activator of photopigment and puc with BLUF domain protein n=1 Tax=Sphingomonas psychrotolerans TaxID=1327635 RepID=A0A2K8MA32_9SPHN|nr:BLUF domain-containing protein [Sphingomonas psychrotolerans]ATY30740.1 activator of photopigment and puc with BLUF domain protein [Sphingomonas psychrotolerans]
MLQLVYVSSVSPNAAPADPAAILAASRTNNRRDAITGLLYSDGTRFLQALEGPEDKVEAAFERIRQDARHRAIVILSRRVIEEREFGEWAMAHRTSGADADRFIERVKALAANAAPDVRATFEGFAKVRRAA